MSARYDVSIKTACPLDCYGTCGLIARASDGKVVAIDGDPEHGATRGTICARGRAWVERLYHPDRLLHPMRKVDGEFRRITWDEALDLIAERLGRIVDESGPLAVFHNWDYGSMGVLRDLDKRFMNALGGVTNPEGSLCSAAGIAALSQDYGRYSSHDPADHANSTYIILWGKNPAVTNIHLMEPIKQAKARGAKVVLIDPIRTASSAVADWHIAPRPGSDGALALAMGHVIVERGLVDQGFVDEHVSGYPGYLELVKDATPEWASQVTGVPAEDIERLAVEYAQRRPAAILAGFGLQRHANGGAMVRAIDALVAITGNIGVAGGGLSYSHRNTKRYLRIDGAELARHHKFIPRARLGRGILEMQDPPIRAIVVTRSNPVTQNPNTSKVIEAFTTREFVAVVDHFMTDTARLADVVLPAAMFLEEEDLYFGYWHHWIAYGPKVVEPAGEARSDVWIFTELAKRMGLGEHFKRTPREWIEYALKPFKKQGITLERLSQGPVLDPEARMAAWEDLKFATESGKFEILRDPKALELLAWTPGAGDVPWSAGEGDSGRGRGDAGKGRDDAGPGRDAAERSWSSGARFPLHLISPQTRLRTHSQFDNLGPANRAYQREEVSIHPKAAAERGIKAGDLVVVSSEYGSITAYARVTDEVREDVVMIPNGRWLSRGGGVNFLTPDGISDIGTQAAIYDCMVDVRPLV